MVLFILSAVMYSTDWKYIIIIIIADDNQGQQEAPGQGGGRSWQSASVESYAIF